MKKTVKKLFSVLLACVMLPAILPAFSAFAEETPGYAVGDHILFGSYPQTCVAETEALAAAAAAANWKSYRYYSGSRFWYDGQMQPGDWMRYADFFCDGEKYRAVTFDLYRPSNTGETTNQTLNYYYQYKNGYYVDTVYYFKYEPLVWRVLDPDTHLILCENIIDTQAFQNTVWMQSISYLHKRYFHNETMTFTGCDYAASSVRSWLNYDFYLTAFTETQRENIDVTHLDCSGPDYDIEDAGPYTETDDKIFFLSYNDVLNADYGFTFSYSMTYPERLAHGTDYAQCQGLYVCGDEAMQNTSPFMLRSPHSSYEAYCVIQDGYAGSKVNNLHGVRPACRLIEMVTDVEVNTDLFSENEHFPGEPVIENIVSATCRAAGGYDMVVYCSACPAELNRTHVSGVPLDHTPGEAVRENEVSATCTKAGGYDEVVYCTGCDYEFSREHITVGQTNHANQYNVAASEATADEHGYTAGVYCPDCDTWLSGHEVIHNHLGEQTVIQEPTETEPGLVEIVCTVCGQAIRYSAAWEPPTPNEEPGGIQGFWMRIVSFFRGFIDWFLWLFHKP